MCGIALGRKANAAAVVVSCYFKDDYVGGFKVLGNCKICAEQKKSFLNEAK